MRLASRSQPFFRTSKVPTEKDKARLQHLLKSWKDKRIFSEKMCRSMGAKAASSQSSSRIAEKQWLLQHPQSRQLLHSVGMQADARDVPR